MGSHQPGYVIAISAFLDALAMAGFSLTDRLTVSWALGVVPMFNRVE
ncbi:MAG: hypothetical protein JW896_07990 [Deltaproteobacteria bacterium]|nr:hypothetical protein [Deltaproteobacteria bacterium]